MICGIITGIIIGFLASKFYSGEGKGCFWNLILGILGGTFGGWLCGFIGIHGDGSWLGEIVIGVVGAVALLWIVNKVFK